MRRAERVTEGPLARMARTTHLANWPTGHPNGQLIDPPVRFTRFSRLSGGTKLAMSVWSTFHGPLSTFHFHLAHCPCNTQLQLQRLAAAEKLASAIN